MYSCSKCDREFTTQTGLTLHSHHCIGKQYCSNPECNKQIKPGNKYCSVRCAALITTPGRRQTQDTRRKISITQGGTGELKELAYGKCLFCGKETKNPKYCSLQCQQDFYYIKKVLQWLNNKIDGTIKGGASSFIRRYLFEKYNYKCSKCGWSKVNPYTKTNLPALEVEHIDGHSDNNEPKNLTLLCPNCQALTSTYKGLNKGNGRRTYMEKYYIKDEQGKIIRGS